MKLETSHYSTDTSTLSAKQIDCDGKVINYDLLWKRHPLGYDSNVLTDSNGQICPIVTSNIDPSNPNSNPKAYLLNPDNTCGNVKDKFLQIDVAFD